MRHALAFLIAFILAFPVHAQRTGSYGPGGYGTGGNPNPAAAYRGHRYHPPGWAHHSHVTGRPTLIPRYHHGGYYVRQ